jgi:hypothetical protein
MPVITEGMTMAEVRPYMQTPRGIVIETEYGKVRLSVTRATAVYVEVGDETGNAHINDDRPALVYRGQEYIGSIHFEVTADGQLAVSDFRGSVHLSKRPQWSDAPRSYATAMLAAISTAVKAHLDAHPELLRKADIAATNNELREAEESEETARQVFGAATEKVHKLRDRLAELTTGMPAF